MAAFERVKSGIPEMDKALDNIRLGSVEFDFRWANIEINSPISLKAPSATGEPTVRYRRKRDE